MALDTEDPKPENNFLYGFSSITRFIADNISIFISENDNLPILPTLILFYLIFIFLNKKIVCPKFKKFNNKKNFI